MPLGNALNPQARGVRASRPAPTPNWAFAAGTRGFTAMPFEGFLGPPSEAADLTRILRRRLADSVYHISFGYSREYSAFFSYYLQVIHNRTRGGTPGAVCQTIHSLPFDAQENFRETLWTLRRAMAYNKFTLT